MLYYSFAGISFEIILPYPVSQGTFVLNASNQEFAIMYNDPDISYRELLVDIKSEIGNPIEIIYTRCSDEARLVVNEGERARFYHNFADSVIVLATDKSISNN